LVYKNELELLSESWLGKVAQAKAVDWKHSSARNYSGIDGVIRVSLFCG